MESINDNSELWQIESCGDIREASFGDVAESIARGELLRIDRVRKGTLRWIEAGKVPALTEFFNLKDLEFASEPTVTTSSGRSNAEVLGPGSISAPSPQVSSATKGRSPSTMSTTDCCSVHVDASAVFVCQTCENRFCKACPTSYGGTVKICPFCGAMCNPIAQVETARTATQTRDRAVEEGFGFADLAEALKYPFKFKVSLILGALMFAFFSIGQGAASFGGAFMLGAAIMCFMCANMLSFGVLANVVENFSQAKIGGNFMPSFDDFNIWDDVVHPFFLMIGVYISSFGPLAVTLIAAMFLISGAMKPATDDAVRAIDPGVASAPDTMQQGVDIKKLVAEQNAREQQRIEQMTDPAKLAEAERSAATDTAPPPTGVSVPPAVAGGSANPQQMPAQPTAAQQEEQHFQNLNNQIAQARKSELEGAFGKTPETQAGEQKAIFKRILGYGAIFLIFAGLSLLWGFFYLPAACCVAGYTRSFAATVNPTVGLDTIKRLGPDYAKLLVMGLAIALMSLLVSGVLAAALNAFALPGVGNVPAKFLSSLLGFYLSVVFSVTLGLALYKAGDRLQLPGGTDQPI